MKLQSVLTGCSGRQWNELLIPLQISLLIPLQQHCGHPAVARLAVGNMGGGVRPLPWQKFLTTMNVICMDRSFSLALGCQKEEVGGISAARVATSGCH